MDKTECLGLCGGITMALSERGYERVRFGLVVWLEGEREPLFVGSNDASQNQIAAMFGVAKITVASANCEYHQIDDECEGHA